MITTNTGAKKIEDTDNWREIFDAHNDSVNAHDKVSEAMTYVVNGNKSIENAAIPVGSYVRLANSTIVGRSDGIYTVKTAIPVNTVIDSSYFNESAPIAGGVANALNSKISASKIAEKSGITTTESSEDIITGHFSDYTLLLFNAIEYTSAPGSIRGSIMIPQEQFIDSYGVSVPFFAGSAWTLINVKKTSDTTYKVKLSGSSSGVAKLEIYGVLK